MVVESQLFEWGLKTAVELGVTHRISHAGQWVIKGFLYLLVCEKLCFVTPVV